MRSILMPIALGTIATLALRADGMSSLSGTVRGPGGEPLAGALVRVSSPGTLEGERVARSDEQGSYRFPALPTGRYRIVVEAPGLASLASQHTLVAGQASTLNWRFKAAPGATVEVTTSRGTPLPPNYATVAGKVPTSKRQTPNSVTVLTREQMDDQNMVTTWDALNQITGITAISNDNTQAQYHARGAALENQQDGIPSSMPLSGYQQFDLAIYERVEVLRGPAGLLQGSGAFSGTVNLVRKRPLAEFAATAMESLGSWNNKHAEVDLSAPLNASHSLRGRAVVAATDRDYAMDRVWDRKALGYGILEYSLAPSTTVALTVAHQTDRGPSFSGLPAYTDGRFLTVPRSFNPYPDWVRTTWDTTDTTLELDHHFGGDWKAVVKLSQRNQELFFHDAYPTTGVNPATMVIANYARREFYYNYQLKGLDGYLSGSFNLFGMKHAALLGANYSMFDSAGRGVNPNQDATLNVPNVPLADPPTVAEPAFVYRTGSESRTTQSGLYGQLRTTLAEGLTSVVGGRWTNYDYKSRNIAPSALTDWVHGANKAHLHFTPYAGLVYDITRHQSLYASYSDIFVAQSQLKSDGSVLQAREGGQLEIGSKGEYRDGKLTTALALFDIIDRNRAYADPAHPGFYVPLGKVESKGWETEVAGKVTPSWEILAGYTNLQTVYLVNATLQGQPISFWYPRHTLKLWSNHRFTRGVASGLMAGIGVIGSSSSASGAPTATVAARPQNTYAVVNAQLAYSFTKELSAALAVNNLFDRTYYTRLGGLNTYNSYGDPRNVNLAIRYSYK